MLASSGCGGSESADASGTGGGGRTGAGGDGVGGMTASGGSAGMGGTAGAGGSKDDGGRADVATQDAPVDTSTTDAPTVVGTCTIGGNDCPSGYQCGCGGPGPGVCECHKKCASAADCSAPNAMCGCSANDPVKICVSMCFCLCG